MSDVFRRSVVLLSLPALVAASAGDASGAGRPAPASATSVGEVIGSIDRQAGSAQAELRRLSERAAQLDAFLAARGRAYVRLARAGMLPAGAGFSALVDHAARLERLRRALERDLRESEAVAKERSRLAHALEELDARRALLETERASLERSHAAIAAAEEREDAFQRAFQSSSFQANHTAVYGSVGADVAAFGGDVDFASLKGRLPFPLAGRSEIRETSKGGLGPGLAMSSKAGAGVHAIHRGRVAFADEYPDLGRAVIVDHGDGFFSVYAGLSEIEARVGEEVRGSDVLGRVGGGGELYVELRRGKETLPPAVWFGI